jgi:hypothetical protein
MTDRRRLRSFILVAMLAGPACGMRTTLDLPLGGTGGAAGTTTVGSQTGGQIDGAQLAGTGGATATTIPGPTGTGGSATAGTTPRPDAGVPAFTADAASPLTDAASTTPGSPDAIAPIRTDGAARTGQTDTGTITNPRGDASAGTAPDGRFTAMPDASSGFTGNDAGFAIPGRDAGGFVRETNVATLGGDAGRRSVDAGRGFGN